MNQAKLELTIITVNLNNLNGLRKTIGSVLCQRYKGYEYIIVDGASEDGSIKLIKDVFDVNPGLASTWIENMNLYFQWISEPDTGIYNAMNRGLCLAKGKYCLFLNSGDWLFDENILSRVFAQKQDTDIISGDIAFFDPAINAVKWIVSLPDVLTAKTLFNGTLPHQATFIKRELFENYGFYNENLKIASDWQFFLETLLEHHVSYFHHKELVSYFNMDGISCRPETQGLSLEEKRTILEKKYPRFIDDYDLLKQLEEHNQLWKESREFQVYCFLEKFSIIGLGVLLIRGIDFLKRKFSKSKK